MGEAAKMDQTWTPKQRNGRKRTTRSERKNRLYVWSLNRSCPCTSLWQRSWKSQRICLPKANENESMREPRELQLKMHMANFEKKQEWQLSGCLIWDTRSAR